MSKLYSVLVALFLAVALLAPTTVYAGKPDQAPGKAKQEERTDHRAGEPDTDHGTGGPDDSSADNNSGDSDAHNNDDEHSNGPNRPEAPSEGAAENANCDNNGFDGCGSVPETPVQTPTPVVTDEPTPSPTPVITTTPVPSTTPTPGTSVTPTPETQDNPDPTPVITTTVEIPFDVPDAGGSCTDDCDPCELLEEIKAQNEVLIAQNAEQIRNQNIIITLLNGIADALKSLVS